MADIFLSYVRSDAKKAKQIADTLSARGWSVWWDIALTPGMDFRDKITEQLEAARCVVVLWSSASLKSHFVIDEAEDGKRRGVLVQALIEDVRPPHGFRQIQAAMLMAWDGGDSGEFARLCEGISAFAPLAESGEYESSAYAEQPAALSGISVAAHPPRILWKRIHTGLAVEVTNLQPQVMKNVQLVLKDMRWWNPEINATVEWLDAQRSEEFTLLTAGQLLSNTPLMLAFIHWSSGQSSIRINGVASTPKSSPPELRLTESGRWSVGFQLKWDGGAHEQGLQFFWAGRNAPVPLPGPALFPASNDPPSSSSAGPRAIPEQWRNLEQRFNDVSDATLRAICWTTLESGGARWEITGGSAKSWRAFRHLAELAGALLRRSLRTWAKYEDREIPDCPDDVRWLYFLQWTGAVTNDGLEIGKHQGSEISNVAQASANACRECAALEQGTSK